MQVAVEQGVSLVHKLVFNVSLSKVKPKLLRLFAILEERGIHLTDRRKAKTLKIVAANALLEGRLEAEERDLIVLKYVAPRDLEDFDKVSIVLSEELKMPERYIKELNDIRANVKEASRLVDSMRSYDPRLVDLFRSLKIAKGRIINILKEADDERVRALANETLAEIDSVLEKISYKLGI
jgi:MoxR-like ATPase